MKNTTFFVCFLLCTMTLYAQPARPTAPPRIGSIAGNITSKTDQKPIEYASVAAFRLPKDTLIGSALSDKKGDFLIEKLPPGNYKIRISYVGYATKFVENIAINFDNPAKNIGKIPLEASDKSLKQVEITAQQSFMENGADRRIFNVSQMPSAQNGNALQVLENLPNVEINQETGGVEMRGSGGILFLIDGKPSGITGADRTAILEQIPSNSIERIEIITNPSAKFDPDGTSGIINIVLKKNKNLGINGNTSIGYGTRQKYDAGANMGVRTQKFVLNTNASYRTGESWVENKSDRQFYTPNPDLYLMQRGYSEITNKDFLGKIGIDYYLTQKTTIGASVLTSGQQRNNDAVRSYTEYFIDDATQQQNMLKKSERISAEPRRSRNTDVNFSLLHDFNPTKQLTILGTRTQSREIGKYNYTEAFTIGSRPTIVQSDTSLNMNKVANIQADFTNKRPNGTKFETGAKMISRDVSAILFAQIQDTTQKLVPDILRNNDFNYKEQIYSFYSQYEGKIKEIVSYQVGLRLEQAYTQSLLFDDSIRFTNNYFSYFPTVNIFKKINNKHDLRFGYARRINRPNIENLNPFTNYADRVNLRIGNPFLRPEYINSFELSYFKNIKHGTLTATAYYRQNSNTIQRTFAVREGLTIISFDNIGNSQVFGLEMASQLSFKNDIITLSPSVNISQNIIQGGVGYTNSGVVAGGKINSNFKLWKGGDFQLGGRYSTPRIVPQGTVNMIGGIDVSLRQRVFDNKGTLSIGCRDLLNTQRFEVRGMAATFSQISAFKRQTQVATVNFTYRFGKQMTNDRKSQRRSPSDTPPEGGGGGGDF